MSTYGVQPVVWDQDARRWVGDFFMPQLEGRYLVPENANNHPEHRGRVGICVDIQRNTTGMSWALMDFEDVRVDAKEKDWIRTNLLVDFHGVSVPYSPPAERMQTDYVAIPIEAPHQAVEEGEDPVDVKFPRVWGEASGHSGNVKITQQL